MSPPTEGADAMSVPASGTGSGTVCAYCLIGMEKTNGGRIAHGEHALDWAEHLLSLLPQTERLILQMVFGFYSGGVWSDQAVATRLGIPRRTVNWTQHKALARLQAHVKERTV